MSSGNFHEFSYKAHAEHYKSCDKLTEEIKETWFKTDTVDYWRSNRMYDLVSPILKSYPGSKWLTVGDGRYGLDSVRLKMLDKSIEILPTDISPYLLQEAYEKGIVNKYRVENAEKLSFNNDEFDFAYCKDAYHHFPRPYLAIYEMLRVSKTGVILLEPNEGLPYPLIKQVIKFFKKGIKKILGKKNHHQDQWNFEEAGNYIYSVSKREIQKIALGLQLPYVMFYFLNDSYKEGVEFEKMSPGSALFRHIKWNIKFKNLQCSLGLSKYNHIMAVLFKEAPSDQVIKVFKSKGFSVELLPRNPFGKPSE